MGQDEKHGTEVLRQAGESRCDDNEEEAEMAGSHGEVECITCTQMSVGEQASQSEEVTWRSEEEMK